MVWERSLSALLLFTATLLVASSVHAATEFWVPDLGRTADDASQRITLANPSTAMGTVVIQDRDGIVQTLALAGGTTRTWTIPERQSVEGRSDHGLRLVADTSIAMAYVASGQDWGRAIAPHSGHFIGTEYRVVGLPGGDMGGRETLTILGTVDGTTVTITSPIANVLLGNSPNTPTQITLDAFEQIRITTDAPNDDWTGTLLNASDPIAVFYSDEAHWRTGASEPTAIATQLFAAPQAGLEFPICSSNQDRGGSRSDTIRIYALEDDTVVEIYPAGPSSLTLDANGWQDIGILEDSIFRSNKPIQIVELAAGIDTATHAGDLRAVLPYDHWLTAATVARPPIASEPGHSTTVQLILANNPSWHNDGLEGNPKRVSFLDNDAFSCETYTGTAVNNYASVSSHNPTMLRLSIGNDTGGFSTQAIPFVAGSVAMPTAPPTTSPPTTAPPTTTPPPPVCPVLADDMPYEFTLDAGIVWSRPMAYQNHNNPPLLAFSLDALESNPVGFDSSSQTLRGNPTASHKGTHHATLTLQHQGCDAVVYPFTLHIRPPLQQQHQNLACPAFMPAETDLKTTVGDTLTAVFRVDSIDGMAYTIRGDLPFGAAIDGRDGILTWTTSPEQIGMHGPMDLRIVAAEPRCELSLAIQIDVEPLPPRCPTLDGHLTIIDIVAGVPRDYTWTIQDPDNVGHILEMLPPTRFRVSGPGLPPSDEPLRTGLDNVTVALEANEGDTGTFGGGFVKLVTGNAHCPDIEYAMALRVSAAEADPSAGLVDETLEAPSSEEIAPDHAPDVETAEQVAEQDGRVDDEASRDMESNTSFDGAANSEDVPLPIGWAIAGLLVALAVRKRL